jgi:predicted nucleic acid-binding protein
MVSSPGSPATPPPVVTDASVWVAFFVAADANHTASRNWLDNHTHDGGMLVAPALLLTEVAAAISRRLGQPQFALHVTGTLSSFIPLRIVQMDASLVTEATNIAAHYRLRGADAIYVAVAKQVGIPLLTWDNEQLTRPAAIISAITP